MHGGTLSSWHQREAGTGAAGSGAAPQYASASEVERSTTCVCDSSCRCACGPRLGMWELWSEGGVSRVLTSGVETRIGRSSRLSWAPHDRTSARWSVEDTTEKLSPGSQRHAARNVVL